MGASCGTRVTAAILEPSTVTVPRNGAAPLASMMEAFLKCLRMPGPLHGPASQNKAPPLLSVEHAGAAAPHQGRRLTLCENIGQKPRKRACHRPNASGDLPVAPVRNLRNYEMP